jgi:hypothetical protein
MSELPLDRAGRRRSPATMPGFHAGRPPRNKGLGYPADPPNVEEIIAVMRAAGDGDTAVGCVGRSSCGEPGCAFKKRRPLLRPISISDPVPCWPVAHGGA